MPSLQFNNVMKLYFAGDLIDRNVKPTSLASHDCQLNEQNVEMLQ